MELASRLFFPISKKLDKKVYQILPAKARNGLLESAPLYICFGKCAVQVLYLSCVVYNDSSNLFAKGMQNE